MQQPTCPPVAARRQAHGILTREPITGFDEEDVLYKLGVALVPWGLAPIKTAMTHLLCSLIFIQIDVIFNTRHQASASVSQGRRQKGLTVCISFAHEDRVLRAR